MAVKIWTSTKAACQPCCRATTLRGNPDSTSPTGRKRNINYVVFGTEGRSGGRGGGKTELSWTWSSLNITLTTMIHGKLQFVPKMSTWHPRTWSPTSSMHDVYSHTEVQKSWHTYAHRSTEIMTYTHTQKYRNHDIYTHTEVQSWICLTFLFFRSVVRISFRVWMATFTHVDSDSSVVCLGYTIVVTMEQLPWPGYSIVMMNSTIHLPHKSNISHA